jgi:ABC-type branched-subunit amino acid transport system ATPase component
MINIFSELSVDENLRISMALSKNASPEMLDYVYELFPILKERRKQRAGTFERRGAPDAGYKHRTCEESEAFTAR